MKTLYIFCLSIFISFSAISQNVLPAKEEIKTPNHYKEEFQKRKRSQLPIRNNKATSCSVDTVRYGQYKSTLDRYINLRTPNSASGYGQYYPVNDTVLVHGFIFYAYATLSGPPEQATASLYVSNSTKLPIGAPIVSESVLVPWTNPLLTSTRQVVLFANPVEAHYSFVLTLESATSNGINVAMNDWDNDDGNGRFYSCGRFPQGWVTGENITVGGGTSPPNLDADAYLEPIVSYKLKSNFEQGDESCLEAGVPFVFKNTSTPILNEVFNPLVIDGLNDQSFEWDYGDGSPNDQLVNGQNTYTNPAIISYNVNLSSSFSGWEMPTTCADNYQGLIEKADTKADFSVAVNNLEITLTDNSVDADEWFWDFGDGNTDTVQSPTHTYASNGVYSIKLRASFKGCRDSSITTVNVTTGIEELNDQIATVYPNPVRDQLVIQLKDQASLSHQQLFAEIYSLTGQLVGQKTIQVVGGKSTLNVAQYKAGSYFLKLTDSDGVLVGKSPFVRE